MLLALVILLASAFIALPVHAQQPNVGKPAARDTFASTNAEVGIVQKLDAQVPTDLQFTDSTGKQLRLGDLLDDRPVILNLVYFECPMLCNLSISGMISSMRAISLDAGEDYSVITVSFDPREGPDMAAAAKRTALTRYGRDGAAVDWHFLTGEEDAIKQLADAVGFRYRYDEKTAQYVHAAGIMVLTPQGRTSRYLLGVEYAPRDLQLSLVEASNNKIGSVTDQVLLLCFQYDPTTGKYGLLIQRVLRVAGVVTVVVLSAGVGGLLIYERRKKQHAGNDKRDENNRAEGIP